MTNQPIASPRGKPERVWLVLALAFIIFWIIYLIFLAPHISVQSAREARGPGYRLRSTGRCWT